MIIACDLDRTLLPNGSDPDDGSLPEFFRLIEEGEHTLVYVTGRNLGLVYEAKNKYDLHLPDFLIGDVGTTIYKKSTTQTLEPFKVWAEYVQANVPQWDWGAIVNEIPQSPSLYLQESWRQNPLKCSYYILTDQEHTEPSTYVKTIEDTLKKINIDAQVIYSEDPLKQVGLIDILPTVATKLTALEYLTAKLEKTWENDVIYCGDSGNDILPLTSGCKAIVVRNAHQDVKNHVTTVAREKKIEKSVYIANGSKNGNGNYASGVIEGLEYFNVIS